MISESTVEDILKAQERLYPVKQIISLATGDLVNAFSGGSEANNYLKAREFEIVDLKDFFMS